MNEIGEHLCLGIRSPPDGKADTIKEATETIVGEFSDAAAKIVAIIGDTEASQKKANKLLANSFAQAATTDPEIQLGIVR